MSRYTWQRLLQLGVTPRSGRVITNGADAARFKAMTPQEVMEFKAGAGVNQGRILLTVGNVSDRKGRHSDPRPSWNYRAGTGRPLLHGRAAE